MDYLIRILSRMLSCKWETIFLTYLDHLSLSLRTLKCELASLLNKENTYQMIIKEKSDAIRKLEKQLADVIQSQSASNK